MTPDEPYRHPSPDLLRRFGPRELVDEIEAHARAVHLRTSALRLAELVAELVPAGREQSLALTAIEECLAWARFGLERNL